MSLADQISEMEGELVHYQRETGALRNQVSDLESDLIAVEDELIEANSFIDFVDKTNPELRVAYDAVKALEGNKNG
jgi:septal ring factor EnvC (AmiA/AmiB activator)